MAMSVFRLRDGSKVDVQVWAKHLDDRKYAELEVTNLHDGKQVSTVWTGIDHSMGGPKPLIFESIVFPAVRPGDPLEQRRYATEEEARTGHAELVAKWSPPVH